MGKLLRRCLWLLVLAGAIIPPQLLADMTSIEFWKGRNWEIYGEHTYNAEDVYWDDDEKDSMTMHLTHRHDYPAMPTTPEQIASPHKPYREVVSTLSLACSNDENREEVSLYLHFTPTAVLNYGRETKEWSLLKARVKWDDKEERNVSMLANRKANIYGNSIRFRNGYRAIEKLRTTEQYMTVELDWAENAGVVQFKYDVTGIAKALQHFGEICPPGENQSRRKSWRKS